MRRIVTAVGACVLAAAVLAPAVGARSTRGSHRADRAEGARLARSLGVEVPKDPTPAQWELRHLRLAERAFSASR